MIDPELYPYIFNFAVLVLTLLCILRYYTTDCVLIERRNLALCLAICAAIFIGFRPNHRVFADTVGYVASYEALQGADFSYNQDSENLVFDHLFLWMSSNQFSYSAFFLVIALVYFVGYYLACQKLFPEKSYVAFLAFLGAFSTFSYATNGIKHGAAAALLACAVAFRERKVLTVILLLLCIGFHHAMTFCVIAFVICYFYKNTKVYLYIWLIALVLALAHITYLQHFFAGVISDKKSAGYMIAQGGWLTGMRYDFVLYSVVPIAIGWYRIYKQRIVDEGYVFVLNLYTLLNSLWLICMYASFTNRIAALSWGLYPIVLMYPFIQDASEDGGVCNKRMSIVLLGHLTFTLMMQIVYYGLLK